MKRTGIIIILAALLCMDGAARGLRFSGMEQPINERTSLEINLSRAASCKDSLSIAFDFMLHPEAKTGFILRLKTTPEANSPVASIFCNWLTATGKFHVVWEKRRFVSTIDLPISEIYDEGGLWVPARLVIFPGRDSVVLNLAGSWAAGGGIELPDKLRPQLSFGRSDYVNDVPSFSIRDLQITADGKSISFPLDEDSGTEALSSNKRIVARAANPIWLANNYSTWKKIAGPIHCKGIANMGYDPRRHEIWSFNRDSISFVKISDGSRRSKAFPAPCPAPSAIGTAFMDPRSGNLYSYELCFFRDSLGGSTLAVLDTASLSWTLLGRSKYHNMQLHHHAQHLDPETGLFTIFGGFGDMSFSGDFHQMKLADGTWTRLAPPSGDRIWPRFFASMGEDPATGLLYVFGGMGNESGDQVVGRQYMYDLFEVDLKNGSSRKMWTADWKEDNCVTARHMVLDGKGSFYVLAYPESRSSSSFCLYRFSLEDGSYEKIADELPIYSDRITTNANLYYDKSLEKLVCTVEESRDDVDSRSTFYTISYPPKAIGVPTVVQRRNKRILDWSISIALAVAALTYLGIALRRRRSLRARIPERALLQYQPAPNSIFLFGDFAAYDRDGAPISPAFTEKLRQLLCLVLQHDAEGGISSKKLSAILWPYKEEDKAKNIRGVTINSLRKTLSRMEGVQLNFDDGKFRLCVSAPFRCDYLEFCEILGSERPDMDRLIRLLSRGKFLSTETDPVYDKMKEMVERKVELVMTEEIRRRFRLHQYRNTITCAEILFSLDPLNEEALSFMLQAMKELKLKDEATARYRDFINRYKKDYNEEYSKSFSDLASGGLSD